MKVLTF